MGRNASNDWTGALVEGANQIFDRKLLARRRKRFADKAAAYDFLLSRVSDDFEERLSAINRKFELGVNLGAYHGLLSRRLRRLENLQRMIDVELSPQLLARCERPCVQADEEFLPIKDQSLDLVVSGLQLHFVNDLPGSLTQVRRALKPDGLLLAALLGGETLRELREAWLIAETEIRGGASPRVAPFADVVDLGGLLQRAGFALPVVDSDVVRVTYGDALALMRELRNMGAGNVLAARSRTPVTKQLLRRVCEIYQDRFGCGKGRVTATFEIMTLTAWAADESQQKPLAPGSAEVGLAEALGVKEISVGERAKRR